KLAVVAGVRSDAPIFDALRSRRLDLGDFDYGQSIAPDLSWSAKRMAVWIEALKPVCESSAMKQRYPDWESSLDSFIRNAYGRPAEPADHDELTAMMAQAPADPVARHRAICLALLSSLEFLVQ